MSTPFLGQILVFAGNFAPKGFALCNGQLLSINSNQALFAILGTTYGGNGMTTFALPDLRGTAVLHFGQGVGLSNYNLGQVAGSETAPLTVSTMPAHTHPVACTTASGNTSSPSGALWAQAPSVSGTRGGPYSTAAANASMASGAIADTGATQPHANVQPVLVVTYIIALQGIFPSRN